MEGSEPHELERPEPHVLEDESRWTFRQLLPRNWITRDMNPDYGLDVEVQIVEGKRVTNKVLWFQIKATENIEQPHKRISYPMKTKHLKHYEGCHLPVIILLWVKSENAFYYVFAQKFIREELSVKKPNWRTQKTNTITFSPDSKLSDVDVLRSIATEGYLYVISQELNVKPDAKSASYWLDGIPRSDDTELKERTLKALLYLRAEKYDDAIGEFEHILRVCVISPTEKMAILINLGNAHYSLSQNDEALKNYNATLELTKKVGEKDALEGKAAALGNIGLIYLAKGELDNALKYFQDALKIDQEIGYRQGEASQLGNIGVIYGQKGELDNALKYHQDALKIHREIGYRQGEANQLGNIGLIYKGKGELDNALKYLQDALKIHREIGYRQGEASQLGNIGVIYGQKGELDNALKYLQDALKILDTANLIFGRDIILRAIDSIRNAK